MTKNDRSLGPHAALAQVWGLAGLGPESLRWAGIDGRDPVLPSTYRVGTAAAATIGATALAASELWLLRGGSRQDVHVNMDHAAAEFQSERLLRVDGRPARRSWDRVTGAYRCGDGRWVRIHAVFPHHRDGVLGLLECEHTKEAVAAALREWEAERFEAAAGDRGLIAAMMRSPAEWRVHPQGRTVAALPPIELERIGDAPPETLPSADRPLTGVRVLDLTRIIAGPVCGRALTAHGADVLRITAPHLPFVETLMMDNGRGKLSAHVDLRTRRGADTLRGLVRSAHVFIQGYRPRSMEKLGFGAEEVAAIRPGIVYVSLSAYGHRGPWRERRGYDSIVQTASGIGFEEGRAAGGEGPRLLPCRALDHASGFLMALGAIAGLVRRATEGGSWHVRVSLAQTGRWIESLGRTGHGLDLPAPTVPESCLETTGSGFGRLTAVRHSAQMSATPAAWARPSTPLGTHPPAWPEVRFQTS